MLLVCIQVVLLLIQLACLSLFVWGTFSATSFAVPLWLRVAQFLAIGLVVPGIVITLVYRVKHIEER